MYQLTETDQLLIDQVMLPFLRTTRFLQLSVAAFDLEGRFLYISEFSKKSRALRKSSRIGSFYKELEDISGVIVPACEKIRQRVIETQKVVHYVLISNNFDTEQKLQFPVYSAQHIPFVNSEEKVIATYIMMSPVTPLNMEKVIFGNIKRLNYPELDVKLTSRQHEILFLLCYNITQSKIANYLNVSRGTVSKIIFDQIMPKFNDISSLEELIEKALAKGINHRFPPTLIKPKVFIIEDGLE